MIDQISLLPPEPERRRDAAIERVRDHANVDWKDYAELSFRRLCAEQEEISSYDVTVRMRDDYPEIVTHELRALGWLFRKYAKAGWIRKKRMGRHPSVSRHATYMQIWEVMRRRD